jgi:hypothetical protein
LTGLGRALYRAGRKGEAEGPLKRAAKVREALPEPSLDDRFDEACGLALLASAIVDSSAGNGAGAAQAARERAMGALKAALAAGFRQDPARVRDTADLTALKDRADFALLLLDLAMPRDPFAREQ